MSRIPNFLLNATGYTPLFLGDQYPVPLPKLNPELQRSAAPVLGSEDNVLDYGNFSIVQHRQRKFPILTAANIDGSLFIPIPRSGIFPKGRDSWRLDPRLDPNHQWGNELYKAPKSDFDRGHMTKREDVQWGKDTSLALNNAKSTFFFTNSVPQHKNLNRKIWQELENYILHSESVSSNLKINLFTGPVLKTDDPLFVSKVNEQSVQIPVLFWKAIYYSDRDKVLSRVAFLMGQENILMENGIVIPYSGSRGEEEKPDDLLFVDFDKADTYQVSLDLIEELTGLDFPPAKDAVTHRRPVELILRETNARDLAEPEHFIEGLVL